MLDKMTENVVLVGKLLFLVLACTLFLEKKQSNWEKFLKNSQYEQLSLLRSIS
nr:MAG: hypothetical protein [Bacteriophage sp.]